MTMPANRKNRDHANVPIVDTSTVRASISFPRDVYEQLEQLAGEKRVSLAWVVREATREYLNSQRSVSKAGN